MLSKFGYFDPFKPQNSSYMNYDLLDQKAIRIINRLVEKLELSKKPFNDFFSNDIYPKIVTTTD